MHSRVNVWHMWAETSIYRNRQGFSLGLTREPKKLKSLRVSACASVRVHVCETAHLFTPRGKQTGKGWRTEVFGDVTHSDWSAGHQQRSAFSSYSQMSSNGEFSSTAELAAQTWVSVESFRTQGKRKAWGGLRRWIMWLGLLPSSSLCDIIFISLLHTKHTPDRLDGVLGNFLTDENLLLLQNIGKYNLAQFMVTIIAHAALKLETAAFMFGTFTPAAKNALYLATSCFQKWRNDHAKVAVSHKQRGRIHILVPMLYS